MSINFFYFYVSYNLNVRGAIHSVRKRIATYIDNAIFRLLLLSILLINKRHKESYTVGTHWITGNPFSLDSGK